MIEPAAARTAIGRILIADDSESNRYVLSTWLRRAGHQVFEAANGTDAIAISQREPLDLVVLDVNLPDMSGYDVCEQIKAQPATAGVPVLHVSATAIEPADRSEGLRRGADGYLIEPVDREVLLASVEALLRGTFAQRTAVRLAWRLRQLNEATLAINDATSFEDLVGTIAGEAARLFGAHAIVLVAGDERALYADAQPHEPVKITPAQHRDLAVLEESAVRDLRLLAPLDTNGDALRGLLVIDLEPPWDDETDVVLTQYARAATIAVRNMRSYTTERSTALFLQRNLLPDELPVIPGITVAARYAASAEHAEVGGDFYECFRLDADRIAIAIGDVVGHSLEAATVMAQLRTGIRSYMIEGHGPAAVLAHLNRLLSAFHRDMTATAICAVYDRTTGIFELANAGHLPPLVVTPSRSWYLPTGGPLLGVDVGPVPAHAFTLAEGDLLLMFTDGLVERRGEDLDEGLRRLAAVAGTGDDDLEAFCERLLLEAGPPTLLDDIALIVLRREIAHERI